MVNRFPEWRDLLWRTFLRCYQPNPAAVRQTISLLSLFLHLGPYARQAIAETETSIADIDSGAFAPPPLVLAVPMAGPLVLQLNGLTIPLCTKDAFCIECAILTLYAT